MKFKVGQFVKIISPDIHSEECRNRVLNRIGRIVEIRFTSTSEKARPHYPIKVEFPFKIEGWLTIYSEKELELAKKDEAFLEWI